ncbi:MAG: hypothetical protein RMN25_11065, partial [Anaerolineae bacterium]|nr:hypothetical protein [Thermoflexales bacterium]MDW8408308.1 hypothetical protein [Anaerolineae bacterium]
NTVTAGVAAAEQAAATLSTCHPSYWVGVTPEALQTAGAELKRVWRTLATDLTLITESGFTDTLNNVMAVKQRQDELNALCAGAQQIDARVRDDEQRARALLDDAEWLPQIQALESIAPYADALTSLRDRFTASYQELKQSLQAQTPYWPDVISRATRLRDELASALDTYRRQVAQTRDELARLSARLEHSANVLDSLAGYPSLDFRSDALSILERIQAWLTTSEHVNEHDLRAMQTRLADGHAIRAEAQERIARMRRCQAAWLAGQTAIESILAQSNALVDRAVVLQQEGSVYGAGIWMPLRLTACRRQLAAVAERLALLVQPQTKLDPDTALAELERIRADAEAILAPLTQAVGALEADLTTLRGLHTELKQLEHRARELSARAADPSNRWADVQERIADLEDRWSHASSFEEARDALQAAQQLVRDLVAPA